MATIALLLVAIAAIAAGTAGGTAIYTDLQDFEMDIKVTDATTNGPVAGAQVDIRDANNVLIAQRVTDEDGEYGLEVDDGADDTDDQGDEDIEEQQAEQTASLGSIAGPLTVTISRIGYETRTFTVHIDTLDDSDMNVKLVSIS